MNAPARNVIASDVGDGVRLITIDNPPVNALSFALSAELLGTVQEAENDPQVRAVVFTGANGLFSGGADVNDFSTEPTPETRTIRDVIAAVERRVPAGRSVSRGCSARTTRCR
jgi:3-hydroxyacyl-CoA dehydrogenase